MGIRMTQKLSEKELAEKASNLYGSKENFKKAVELVEASKKGEVLEDWMKRGFKPDDEIYGLFVGYYAINTLFHEVPKALSNFDSTVRALSSKFNLDMSDTMENLLEEFKKSLDERFENLDIEIKDEINNVQDEKIMLIRQSKEDLVKSVNAIADSLKKVNHDFEIFESRILSVIDKASEGAIAKQQAEITSKVMATIKKEIPIIIGTTMKKQYNLWALDRFFRDVGVVVLAGSVLGILFKLVM